MDPTNVGDWYCSPFRYFELGDGAPSDIKSPNLQDGDSVILGGGGLISANFAPYMLRLAERRSRLSRLIAWGIGESLRNDKSGGLVDPWQGPLPDYLGKFDLVGLRDYGTVHDWVPCASCMLGHFDRDYPVRQQICIYEHKRIPIPIAGLPRRSNDGNDIDATLEFLGSAEVIITNSYHGAYWATLLGRRVIAIPNLSKMYGFYHKPVICAPEHWQEKFDATLCYPSALSDCRAANAKFHEKVRKILN